MNRFYVVRSQAQSHLLAHERASAHLAAHCLLDLVTSLSQTTEPLRWYLYQLPCTM